MIPFKFPPVIRIEPSASCNLACAHCPTGTFDMARGIMKSETFERLLAQLPQVKEHIRTAVLYHGGEPLLNKHFPRMIRDLRAFGIPNIKTVSNGMLLDSKRTMEILNSEIDIIEFSLDGRSPEENHFLRRKSSFETVTANIRAFMKARSEFEGKRPKVFVSNTQVLPADNPQIYSSLPSTPSYIRNALSECISEIDFKCTWAMEWPHMGEEVKENFDLWAAPERAHYLNQCSLVDETMTVRWNGDVVACCYDLTSRFVLGNIQEQSISEIWEGQKYELIRKTIASGKPIPLCKGCNVIRPPVYLLYKPELERRFNEGARRYQSESSLDSLAL